MRPQDMEPHRIRRGIVENECQVIEADDISQTSGQVLEQRGQVVVGDDRF